MRRYRDNADLRKLKPADDARVSFDRSDDRRSPTPEELKDAQVNHYAVIDAAAAIASAKLTDRLTALFVGAVAILSAVGGGALYLLDQAIKITAQKVVNEEFDKRGNEIFGFFALQRRFYDLKQEFEIKENELQEQEESFRFRNDVTEQEQESLRTRREATLDEITEELKIFAANLAGEASDDETFDELISFRLRSAERVFMEDELLNMYVDVADFARRYSYYDPIVDLYLAAPRIALRSEPFLINFAYASSVMLLSDPILATRSQEGRELHRLYQGNQDVRRVLVRWPEYRYLFGTLIEKERGRRMKSFSVWQPRLPVSTNKTPKAC